MSGEEPTEIAPEDRTLRDILASMPREEAAKFIASNPGSLIEFTGFGFAKNRISTAFSRQQIQELIENSDTHFRGSLPASGNNYPGHSHEEIKSYIETIDIELISEASRAFHELSESFSNVSNHLNKAIERSQQEWTGEAADQAHRYFNELKIWAEENSANAQLSSEVLYQKSVSAEHVKTMPEPIPFNMAEEMRKWREDPFGAIMGGMDETFQKQRESQEAHERAAEMMTEYDEALRGFASRQPVFPEPPKPGGEGTSASSTPTSAVGSVGATAASGFTPGTGVAGGAGGAGAGAGAMSPGGGTSASGGVAPVSTPVPGGRDTGAGAAPGAGRPGSSTPLPPTRVPGSPGSRQPGRGAGGMGAVPVGGMAGAGGAGGSPGARTGGFGPGRGGGFGPGGGAGAGSVPGAGGRAGAMGMGPGAPGAAPGGAGAAAAAGRGGMGAAPMGAAGGRGGGQGSEDTEHQRPTYLVEGDPDEVFGTDERTAPPVIGA